MTDETGTCANCGTSIVVDEGTWVCDDCGAKHDVKDASDDETTVLGVISDEASRAVLRSLGPDMTPQDISEECDVPISTVYRKLETMKEMSLVKQDVRMEKGKTGGHPETFEPNFEAITVELTDGGEQLRVRVSRTESEGGAAESLAEPEQD